MSPREHQNKAKMNGFNICVFGKKGFGKTTWIQRYIFENPDKVYLIYDHHDEYWTDPDTGEKIFENAVKFIELANLTAQELKEALHRLPDDTTILYLAFCLVHTT